MISTKAKHTHVFETNKKYPHSSKKVYAKITCTSEKDKLLNKLETSQPGNKGKWYEWETSKHVQYMCRSIEIRKQNLTRQKLKDQIKLIEKGRQFDVRARHTY